MSVHQVKCFVCLLKALWWESEKYMIICGSSSYPFIHSLETHLNDPQCQIHKNLKNFDAILLLLVIGFVWQILASSVPSKKPKSRQCLSSLPYYSSFNLCISRSTGDVHTEIICWMGFCALHLMRSKRLNSKRRASERAYANPIE